MFMITQHARGLLRLNCRRRGNRGIERINSWLTLGADRLELVGGRRTSYGKVTWRR